MSIDSTLSRPMTVEQEFSLRKGFVPVILPGLIAVAALAFYLATLNRWVSLGSLLPVARLSDWVWQPQLNEPLYWLVTYPLHWLPVKTIPLALHLLSAICAVLTLALLARSVALLPHDRTHEQRQREHSEFSLLSIPLAWLPPVLAVVVCGLQLTFWEHATAASGEMLNLLVFAYIIRCVLEFRIDERESWLTRAALVYGLGMTNNWAMIGFLPLFIASLVWIRGLNFFNLQFLGRMFLFSLAGMLLYLLLPLVQSNSEIARVPFWQALKANVGTQEGILASLFRSSRQTIALLSLTSLVPLFIIGIRWASYFGDSSRLGVALATLIFHVVHVLFLIACTWVALDPPFSPRHVGFGFPFLTFYYLGALCVGYLSGYFLLVFRPQAERSYRRQSYLPLVNNAVTGAILLLLVAAPGVLIYRNLPQIRATNGTMLRELGSLLVQTLPAKGAVVLSDDPRRTVLARMAARKSGLSSAFLFVDSGSLTFPDYWRYMKKRHGAAWPSEVAKERKEPVQALEILQLIATLAASNSTYYLHPSFGYYFEFFHLEPHGLVYAVSNYSSSAPLPPKASPELIAENEDFWSRADDRAIQPVLTALATPAHRAKPSLMERFTQLAHLQAEPNREAKLLASYYSRALDYWAVELQKCDELKKAAAHFESALELNPDNVAAEVNLECNKSLQAGTKSNVQMSKTTTDSFGKYRSWDTVLGENGPFDEPNFCYEQGQAFVRNRQYRQAAQQFTRVKELDNYHLSARLWLAQLYIIAQRPDEALRLVEEIQGHESLFGVNRTNVDKLLFAEASTYLAKKNGTRADAAVEATLQQYSNDQETLTNLLAQATQAYMNFGYFSNALRTLERHLALAPNNIGALINKGYAYLQMNAFEQAIPPLTRVLTLETNNYSALLNRAIAYLRSNQLEASQRDYETLQKALPTAYQIYYGLGEIAFRRNDTNSAIRNYELYLTNAPPNLEEAKGIRTRLQDLMASRR